METVTLGRAGLTVSRLALGGYPFGGVNRAERLGSLVTGRAAATIPGPRPGSTRATGRATARP